jgi:hypothetical protein
MKEPRQRKPVSLAGASVFTFLAVSELAESGAYVERAGMQCPPNRCRSAIVAPGKHSGHGAAEGEFRRRDPARETAPPFAACEWVFRAVSWLECTTVSVTLDAVPRIMR